MFAAGGAKLWPVAERQVAPLFTLLKKLTIFWCLSGMAAAAALDPVGSFEHVRRLAQVRAAAPFVAPAPLPEELRRLDYDQMRDLRFDPPQAVWRREGLPFQLQFFHPGGGQQGRIVVHEVAASGAAEIPFDRKFFDYSRLGLKGEAWGDLHFSGFRVHHPLNRPDYFDELLVFQGGTYFRALPRELIYGLSARAVAVNCGRPGPEEFPAFREFWIRRPEPGADSLRIVGLFDSPSLAGAAEFVVHPGAETRMECRVFLAARTELAHYGIAPLTSMYWFGKSRSGVADDYRPEVHDSDGLLLQDRDGAWLWRPLDNDGRLRLSAFPGPGLRGYGLLQREREFACYQDLEALYHRRPSAWVEPLGAWGPGAVQLLELPTRTEYEDNIVAFWEPSAPLAAGTSAEFAYRLAWFGDRRGLSPAGRVVAARSAAVPGQPRRRKFVLDFADPGLGQGAAPEPAVAATQGRIEHPQLTYNPQASSWRLAFEAVADTATTPMELRAAVRKDGAVRTETWIFNWTP